MQPIPDALAIEHNICNCIVECTPLLADGKGGVPDFAPDIEYLTNVLRVIGAKLRSPAVPEIPVVDQLVEPCDPACEHLRRNDVVTTEACAHLEQVKRLIIQIECRLASQLIIFAFRHLRRGGVTAKAVHELGLLGGILKDLARLDLKREIGGRLLDPKFARLRPPVSAPRKCETGDSQEQRQTRKKILD